MIAITIFLIAFVAFAAWYTWACWFPASTFFRPVLVRGPHNKKHLALTFDDGPTSPFTGQILDLLRDQRVTATFFLCGKNAERHPELVRRIVAEGHTLGNHTYSHLLIQFWSLHRVAAEIDFTQEIIERAAGRRPQLFRPPYGARWFGLSPFLTKRGLRMVQWSAMGYDWKNDAPGITSAVLKELKPGAIILLHDGREARPDAEVNRSQTLLALPGIIYGARSRGYEFVSLQDFLPSTSV